MHKHNIFESIPERLDDELIESLFKNEKINIERIVSKGHRSPENAWYDQIFDEWVIVLKGAATLEFESLKTSDRTISLTSGDYIYIAAHTKHKVTWTDPNLETVWLAVHC